ncbi:TPA: DUF493 domain-containing protein [Legionella pneumophila]|uniref:UPF0250 protein NCTC12000_01636 n=1 Tax=Legionella pneumophila TaxID=446 RepID=A0A378KD33_LEGPN|nr:DUF493 domain-containing protein [Legionella pneumophila]MCK1858646.1 DUF493 domain-containing protein [Legionella pneumophila]MCO1451539.1 DUF493 domain-containing protein [Legionella pneumophila]MCW8402390.1 DUF493 domain-containing protein [Legionella pneumophila]MCW8433984.1 DUF493 domain-containing protein [Legionella pneumophila]MCW8467409.1 DUF493 domain-containing protein [Legionella pneumophila]
MTKTTLIEFPCYFPIKIIGINSELLLNEIRQIVINHFPTFKNEHLTHKTSEQDKYLAITVTVYAENQISLDGLYQDLSQHPAVKMVL